MEYGEVSKGSSLRKDFQYWGLIGTGPCLGKNSLVLVHTAHFLKMDTVK